MFDYHSDKEWERFGSSDPYYGVITHDRYKASNMTEQDKEEFFSSGFNYIGHVINNIKSYIDKGFVPKRALDFGCGVGRLVIPLSNIASEVTGVDVSDSMLNEAQKNCKERCITNVTLIKSDDNLSCLRQKYDLIHSFIVFQHIPVSRGERIFKNLLSHLEDGGVCVVHFTYLHSNKLKNFIKKIQRYIPLLGNISNLIKGRKFFYPQMQMNSYDLNRLLLIVQKLGISNCLIEFTDHGGALGVVIYFKKPIKPI